MGLGNLTTRAGGQPVDETWWNTIQDAIKETLVPRNSSGVPTAGQDLGSSTYPWGRVYADSLVVDGSLVDLDAVTNLSPYKIVSGKIRSTSNQPAFLTPAGSGGGRSLTISATATNLVYQVADTTVTLAADIVVSALTAAPSSNNTATINDASASGQNAYRMRGASGAEYFTGSGNSLTITSAGTEITDLVGKRAAFKLTHSGSDEYFTARIESSTSLKDCYRGFFYDSSLNPINAVTISNSDTITLMKLGWLFLDVNGTTTDTVYNEPVYGGTQPSSPASGDYWYDTANSQWKRYTGSTYASVDRILIGMFFCDATDCLGVRCFDFFATQKQDNTVRIGTLNNADVSTDSVPSHVVVMGNKIDFGNKQTWEMATHLAASTDMYTSTEQASRVYFFYVTDEGSKKISDIMPYYRGDLLGWYHPHNPWRCVFSAYNDVSSNLSNLDYAYYPSMDRPRLKFSVYDLEDDAVTTPKIIDEAVTSDKWSENMVVGTASGTYSNATTTFTGIGGAAVITTKGRPVRVIMCPTVTGAGSYVQLSAASGLVGQIRCNRDGTNKMEWDFQNNAAVQLQFPGCLVGVDTSATDAPGTYSYQLVGRVTSAGTITVENVNLIVEEI